MIAVIIAGGKGTQAGFKVGCRTISIGAIQPEAKYVTRTLLDSINFIFRKPVTLIGITGTI